MQGDIVVPSAGMGGLEHTPGEAVPSPYRKTYPRTSALGSLLRWSSTSNCSQRPVEAQRARGRYQARTHERGYRPRKHSRLVPEIERGEERPHAHALDRFSRRSRWRTASRAR